MLIVHYYSFGWLCFTIFIGGKLLNGIVEVDIYGEDCMIKAEIGRMPGMSAYCDYDDLCRFISNQGETKKLFLVHEEYDVQTAFVEKLIQKGFDIEIPGMNYAVNLSH